MNSIVTLRSIIAVAIASTSLQTVAAGKITYASTNTIDATPNNEINQGDFTAEYNIPVFSSAGHHTNITVGGSLQDTHLAFDDSRADDLDLLKVLATVTGTHLLDSGKVVSWTVTPGLHGLADDMSNADFRIETTAMIIFPREKHQFVVGAGYSEIFGEPQLYPMIGSIWTLSPDSQLSLILPMVTYQKKLSPTSTYRVSLAPQGAEWGWEADTLAPNTSSSNVSMTGIALSGGMDWSLSDKHTLTLDVGWVFNREITLTNAKDSDREGTADLEDALYVKAGLSF